jgi:hypothetical protein
VERLWAGAAMGREIGARTLVSESGSLWTCPVRPDVGPDLRGSPHGGCLKPWSRPAPATRATVPQQACSLQPRGRRSRGPERGGDRSVGAGAGAGAARGERSEPP